ncbi:hypothetical protein N9M15_00365 [Bacteroidia bacterium]|nr:hypothetical protein [Bacteroidia bacterium]
MLDTVNFWLPLDLSCDREKLRIIKDFDNIRHYINYRGESCYRVSHLNYNIKVSNSGIYFNGSLSKYFFGHNFYALTISQTIEALNRLEDEVHLSLDDAKIMRLDTSNNLIMSRRPEAYFQCLGGAKYYERYQEGGSLYYSTKQKQIVFYDKVKEATSKKVSIPSGLRNSNLLRYEVRLKKRIAKQLQMNTVHISDLRNVNFHNRLIKFRTNEYQKIKLRKIPLNVDEIHNPRDLFNQLLLFGIHCIGEDEFLTMIDNLKYICPNMPPEYRSRIKRKYLTICDNQRYNKESQLANELDIKMKESFLPISI